MSFAEVFPRHFPLIALAHSSFNISHRIGDT